MLSTLRYMVEAACRDEGNRFGYGIWTHHIVWVVDYGQLLAAKLGADPEVVEIAALLHDYASIKGLASNEDHHVAGAHEAERILKGLDYPAAKMHAVVSCILSHRGSVTLARTTPEAICLASADAMAHIRQVPSLLFLTYVQLGMSIDEGTAWVRAKLERSWHKMCPEAQTLIRDRYIAAQSMLDTVNVTTT